MGVHVRRGDYAQWANGEYFFSDAEYLSVIASFLRLHTGKTVRIVIATNDKAINRERYETLGVPVYFQRGSAAEDLCLLSHCDYLIGPLSTFSLVASFYRDIPLYWILDKRQEVTPDAFRKFDYLFRHLP